MKDSGYIGKVKHVSQNVKNISTIATQWRYMLSVASVEIDRKSFFARPY